MSYLELTPMLVTNDIDETVEFYTRVLGFTCEALDEEYGWVSLGRDNVRVMFTRSTEYLPFDRPGMSGSLYIYTDDVEADWERLRFKAKVCFPIEDFDYGTREFGIYDNNGYLLQFAREMGDDEFEGEEDGEGYDEE